MYREDKFDGKTFHFSSNLTDKYSIFSYAQRSCIIAVLKMECLFD